MGGASCDKSGATGIDYLIHRRTKWLAESKISSVHPKPGEGRVDKQPFIANRARTESTHVLAAREAVSRKLIVSVPAFPAISRAENSQSMFSGVVVDAP